MILELEDMNPVEDPKVGETFWQPINMQDAGDPQKLGAQDQADIDTKKATDIAEHQAQMAQDTAKTQTNLQMKAAEQSHGHAMEAAKVGNAHTQKMAKIAPQSAVSQPAAGGGNPPAAAANQPDAPVPAKQTKRSSDVVVIQAEMRAAQEDGFIFISSVREPEGVSYRYLNPDHSELYIVHTAKLEPRFNENHDAKGEFTSGSNAEKIEKLKSENAKVLATPLMS